MSKRSLPASLDSERSLDAFRDSTKTEVKRATSAFPLFSSESLSSFTPVNDERHQKARQELLRSSNSNTGFATPHNDAASSGGATASTSLVSSRSAVLNETTSDFSLVGTQVISKFIGQVVTDKTTEKNPISYKIVSRLGEGTWNSAYVATTVGAEQQKVVLKRFYFGDKYKKNVTRNGSIATLQGMIGDIEHEVIISRLIAVRSHGFLCEKAIVCAEKYFKESENVYFIVFPYDNGIDLGQYRETVLAPKARGPPLQKTQVTREVLGLLGQLLEIVAQLDAINVAHVDLKLANIIILPDGSLRLIDLGIGTYFPEDTDEGVIDTAALPSPSFMINPTQLDEVSAGDSYRTTQLYQDPQAVVPVAAKDNQVVQMSLQRKYHAYAVYACGIIAQLMLDPLTPEYSTTVIQIHQTEFMPNYVLAMIKEMTTTVIHDRRSAADYATKFKIAQTRFIQSTLADSKRKRILPQSAALKPPTSPVVVSDDDDGINNMKQN